MIVARQLDEPRAGNPAGDVAAFFDLQAAVVRAMQDQRRHANRRQDVPDVDLRVHLRQRERRAGARAHPQIRRPPRRETPDRRPRSARAPRCRPGRPSRVRISSKKASRCFARRSPGIVRVAQALRVGADHDERRGLAPDTWPRRALHIGPPSDTPNSAARCDSDRVHHRAHIVHPLLERRQLR